MTKDLMEALEKLRAEMHKQGLDIHKLVEKHDDHEKRIQQLEPLRNQVMGMTQRLSDIGNKVTVMHQLLEGVDTTMSDAIRTAGRTISSEVSNTVRAEVGIVREEVQTLASVQFQLTKTLEARPCITGKNGKKCKYCEESESSEGHDHHPEP